jgi:AraC family transcriptional regulator, regulatory protein of adaptative response / methylated-DNA-[protein]-cysteine methyltransferase
MSSRVVGAKAVRPEIPISTDEIRWRAVLARDANLDGIFVTGVLTTGIYCRPSCPARHPKRENVRFFGRPEEAERAGFRACLRCRPKEGGRPNPQADMVRQVCRILVERPEERVTLTALAREVGVSPHHLQRTFKRAIGISPRQYADALRLGRLKQRLQGKDSVTMALYEAGYGSSSRLYETSTQRLGMTPGAYRDGGRGARIRYAVADTPIGRVLVAATERGICSVRIGASGNAMAKELGREFPTATIERDREGLAEWVKRLTRHLEGRAPELDVPIDVRATAFQWRVYEALRSIPYGETRTYREVARSIGAPRAARAVGRACATNPVGIVIPCHRVVREGGALGGYAWGLGIKKQLLESERRGAGRARRRS